MDECVFCKIAGGVIQSKKVFEDEHVIAFENTKPVATTHLLICPKKHIENFMAINKNFNLSPMIQAAQIIIDEKNLSNGYKIIFNGGKYQSIPHLHWHLLAGELEANGDAILKT